jgi:hypothetical protein
MKRADDDDSAERLQKLQREILSYLMRHPDAKDTLEGITQWWLPAGSAGPMEVDRLLEALVRKGWLAVCTVGSGRRVYGLERDRRPEIEKWLGN